MDRVQSQMGTQSAFREDGSLDPRFAGGGQVKLGEYLDLSSIAFPGKLATNLRAPDGQNIPAFMAFDGDHAVKLSQLVTYMATLPESWGGGVSGALSEHDGKVLHAVAMLYALGGLSQTPSNAPDGIDAARSAAKADEYLRAGIGAGTYWGRVDVREETCRLIFRQHDATETRADKRLQIFQDAWRFELARVAPNTAEGLRVIKAFCNKSQQATWWLPWSRSRDNFVDGWMRQMRGWK